MLERLSIRDLVLVEHAEVSFGDGLNAITGETGAGKSLLVQAIELLVGARADSAVVREGAQAAVVEGEFHLSGELAIRVGERLDGWGIAHDDGVVIVRREVGAHGRSRALVNQSPVTRTTLAELGALLVDFHGQHEHQSLLAPDAALDALDRLGGLSDAVAAHAAAFAAMREAAEERDRLAQSLATWEERRDYLEQAARDLDAAQLQPGEDEALRNEATRLAHGERLRTLVAQALDRLAEGDGAALDAIGAAERAVQQAASLDPSLEPSLESLDGARIAVAEATRQLGAYAASLEGDPAALEGIEQRRELLSRLERRYRRDLAGLIAWRDALRDELALGQDGDAALERARTRATETERACLAAGRALTRARTAAAKRWSAEVTKGLAPLGFPNATLAFTVEPAGEGLSGATARGLDRVEIRFGANPGEPARPLAKIASGGELSRVMLALKTALETQDRVDLLLFDEVDSGIGGVVAQAVGQRLRQLARHRQLVCVTHLPMIAALASHHLRVSKHVSGGRTVARIELVAGPERVEELARMLAGERVTDTTRRQARELIAASPAGRAR